MRWGPDKTGRFAQRPFYVDGEMDAECENLVVEFLRSKYGKVQFPISTDDLVVLVEKHAEDLDVYADLSGEGPDVEGITYFNPSGKPSVKIASHLVESANHNRFRTTLTHELGHVKFHNFLWPTEPRPLLFYPEETPPAADPSPRCKREVIHSGSQPDWMEWQAGYACGALLMPISHIQKLVSTYRSDNNIHHIPVRGQDCYDGLVREVSSCFAVSSDAARVRLTQAKFITNTATQTANLFG